jgi:hypothetical protein
MEGEERWCRKCYTERERETIKNTWNGCSEMRERERKERGEIQKKKGMGDRNKNVIFRNC